MSQRSSFKPFPVANGKENLASQVILFVVIKGLFSIYK